MKNKIESGQCYEENDHVYEAIALLSSTERLNYVTNYKGDLWWVQDTLTKERQVVTAESLSKLRRPFQNFG